MNDTTNTSNIGLVTDLFIFTNNDNNKFVIQGMGTIDGEDENNEIANLVSAMLAQVSGFTKTDELHHVGKFEEGATFLPHYPYGTIYSMLGNYDVLLIGGPTFDEYEIERKAKLN